MFAWTDPSSRTPQCNHDRTLARADHRRSRSTSPRGDVVRHRDPALPRPKPFDSIVPAELPGSARVYTYASGVGELATGALLASPRTRRLGALAAVALFISVFPANVNMVRLWWNKPWPLRLGAIARLPLQIPMITTALKVYRHS